MPLLIYCLARRKSVECMWTDTQKKYIQVSFVHIVVLVLLVLAGLDAMQNPASLMTQMKPVHTSNDEHVLPPIMPTGLASSVWTCTYSNESRDHIKHWSCSKVHECLQMQEIPGDFFQYNRQLLDTDTDIWAYYSYGSVELQNMIGIAFEDCDYLSHKFPLVVWNHIRNIQVFTPPWNIVSIELHVGILLSSYFRMQQCLFAI